MADSPGTSGASDRAADLLLAKRASDRQAAALHQLVDGHADRLFRLARRLCRSTADAEDVVQETLLAVFRSIDKYDGRSSLLTWMSSILVRKARRLSQRQASIAVVNSDVAAATAISSDRPSEASDSRADLAAVLPQLTPEHREVLVLRELQHMSYADIAAALDVPQGTVESRLHRGRAELRRLLRAYDPIGQSAGAKGERGM